MTRFSLPFYRLRGGQMVRWIFAVVWILGTLISLPSARAQSGDGKKSLNFTWNGYMKHMHTAIYQPFLDEVFIDGLFQNRLNFTLAGDQSPWVLHAGLRNRLFYGNYFELDPDRGLNIHVDNNDFLPLSINILDGEHLLLNTYLDRLYVQWSRKAWEIRVGRQRINWGISTFWNPNDLFNTFDFTDFDYEERPGSDAVRITWYAGPVSRLEGAIQMADRWDDVTAAMLYRWNSGAFDFQIIGGKFRKNITVGGGWSGYLGDVGFKGELMYFDATESGVSNTFNLTAGLDYFFGDDVFAGIGYLYNESGTTGQGSNLFLFELSARNLYPYRHAMYGNANIILSPLLTAGASLVYSPVKSDPWFISPNLSYSLATNWDLDFVSQFFVAEAPTVNLNVFAFFLRTKWSF